MPSRCRWSVSSWRKKAASSCHGKGIRSLTPRCGLSATRDRSGSLSGPLDILAPERTHQTIGTILLQAALDLERRAISRLCLSPTPMIHSNQPKLSPAHLSGEGTPCTPITPVFKRLARRLRTDTDRCLCVGFPAARASSRTAGRCWGRRDARGDRRIAIGLSASFPRKREPMNTGGARDARTVVMGPRLRGDHRALAGSPSADDRRAALLVVAVDPHALPHAV